MTINASFAIDNKVYTMPSFKLPQLRFSNLFATAGGYIDSFLRFLGEAICVVLETLNPLSTLKPKKKQR